MKEKFDWFREQLRRLLSQPEIADDGRPRNAVGYVRSAVENAETMASQREALQNWADNAGCHIVRWYGEGGRAAGKDPALDHLLLDAASDGRVFDAVLVWDYARVSRSPWGLLEVNERLSDLDVELVCIKQIPGSDAERR